jgi:hypothetical protein
VEGSARQEARGDGPQGGASRLGPTEVQPALTWAREPAHPSAAGPPRGPVGHLPYFGREDPNSKTGSELSRADLVAWAVAGWECYRLRGRVDRTCMSSPTTIGLMRSER